MAEKKERKQNYAPSALDGAWYIHVCDNIVSVYNTYTNDCKKGVARCHPEDKFNIETGVKLAFERYFNSSCIDVNDIVSVVENQGECFPYYTEIMEDEPFEIAMHYAYGKEIPNFSNRRYKVFSVKRGREGIYYIIQDCGWSKEVYIVNKLKIKKVQ